MNDKSLVSLSKVHAQAMTSEIERTVSLSLARIDAFNGLKKKGKTVLIKPNIASPGGLYSTNPSVTYAAAKVFSEKGFVVWIGENPSIPTGANTAYEEYGLADIAERAGAKCIDMRNGPHVEVPVPEGELFRSLEISKYAIDADIIVSVATMKSANIVTATLSVKNMKGVIPSKWKRKFHCEGLNSGIADLMRVVKPDISIIDCTMGKDMSTGCCYPVGLIISSRDPLAADAVCARIMGYDPYSIEHLKAVADAGLGSMRSDEIDIVGEDVEDHIGAFPFSAPRDPFAVADASEGRIKIVQGDPCSVCLNELGTVLYLFQDRIDEIEDLTILIGQKASTTASDEGRTVIGYGNCVNQDVCDYRVSGCPPTDYREADTGSLIDIMNEILNK